MAFTRATATSLRQSLACRIAGSTSCRWGWLGLRSWWDLLLSKINQILQINKDRLILILTSAKRTEFFFSTLTPVRHLYGERFLKMWPTWEHGTISRVPPHIHVLNESSKFSPPQMSKPLSYVPSLSKNSLSIANNPPAMVGDHTGSAVCLCLALSFAGTGCQLNWRFQSNPPTLTDDESL